MGELIEGAVQQAPQPLRQEGEASGGGMWQLSATADVVTGHPIKCTDS